MLYYSEILNKKFVTEEELRAAEEKYAQKQKEKENEAIQRKEDAKKVEDAANHFLEVKRETSKTVQAAYDEFVKLRDQFIQKYGGWHYTFTSTNDGEKLSLIENKDDWKTFGDFLSIFKLF